MGHLLAGKHTQSIGLNKLQTQELQQQTDSLRTNSQSERWAGPVSPQPINIGHNNTLLFQKKENLFASHDTTNNGEV